MHRHVISLKNGFNDTSKGNYDSIHPIVAYRLLKIEIAQLHKTLRENEDLAYLVFSLSSFSEIFLERY